MKIPFILSILLCSSVAIADNISCPTSSTYPSTLPWKIDLGIQESDCSSLFMVCTTEPVFHQYHPNTKKIDDYAFTFKELTLNPTSSHIEGENTLVCEGTYAGSTTFPGYVWGEWTSNEHGILREELPLGATYKTCIPMLDKNGPSFSCTK